MGNDNRRHCSSDMGCRRHLFLPRERDGETNASIIVDAITKDWLGAVGGVLAILGVIAAPITSGDTAFRSARLIVAGFSWEWNKIHASPFIYMHPDVPGSH